MEHVNGWCFRGIYKGGLWEGDLHVSARYPTDYLHINRVVANYRHLAPKTTRPKTTRQALNSSYDNSSQIHKTTRTTVIRRLAKDLHGY